MIDHDQRACYNVEAGQLRILNTSQMYCQPIAIHSQTFKVGNIVDVWCEEYSAWHRARVISASDKNYCLIKWIATTNEEEHVGIDRMRLSPGLQPNDECEVYSKDDRVYFKGHVVKGKEDDVYVKLLNSKRWFAEHQIRRPRTANLNYDYKVGSAVEVLWNEEAW